MKQINMEWMQSLLYDYKTDQDFDYETTLSNEQREKGKRMLRQLYKQINEYVENNDKEYLDDDKISYRLRDKDQVQFEGLRHCLKPHMCKYISYAAINAKLFPFNTTYQKMTKDLYKRYLGIDDDAILDELERYKISKLCLGWPIDIEIENEYQYKLRKNQEQRAERKRQAAEARKKKKNLAKQIYLYPDI